MGFRRNYFLCYTATMGDGAESPEVSIVKPDRIVYRRNAASSDSKPAKSVISNAQTTRALPNFGGLAVEKKASVVVLPSKPKYTPQEPETRKDPPKQAGFAAKAASAAVGLASLFGVAGGVNAATSHSDAGSSDRAIVEVLDAKTNSQPISQGHGEVSPQTNTKPAEVDNAQSGQDLFDTVFHALSPEQKTAVQDKINELENEAVSNNDMFKAYNDIVVRYGPLVKQASEKYGVSEDIFYGIIFVESKGDTNAYNEVSGSAGLVQFLESTWEEYSDDPNARFDPEKCLDASGLFLKTNKDLLGGIEGAVWANNAGPGTVMRAWETYFKSISGKDIGDYGEAIGRNDSQAVADILKNFKDMMDQYNPNFAEMIANQDVQNYIAGLEEDTGNYFYRVMAAAMALRDQGSKVADLGGGVKVTRADKPVSNPLLR